MNICAFTIVTCSHIAGAKLLEHSIKRFNPNWDVYIVILDHDFHRPDINFASKVLSPEQLVHQHQIPAIRRQYTAAEYCFYLKPFAAKHLFKRGYVQVHYFDSDIKVYSSLDVLCNTLNKSSIILTPHYFELATDDCFQPNALTLLKAGVFNAGYIGMRNSKHSEKALNFWAERLKRYGRNDPINGMCGDQKWLDLWPVLFDHVKILKHPGCNVGYWNLHERHLLFNDDKYYVNNKELLFFHFSGLEFENDSHLSKYSTSKNIMKNSIIKNLADQYRKELSREGEAYYSKLEYPYKRFIHFSGIAIRLMRSIYFAIDEFKRPGGCE